MQVFKTKFFHQWAKKIKLQNTALIKAIDEIQQGVYEASLGSYLYKKRIAIGNQGKRGGLRTIIAFKKDDKAFFIYGYAKNKRQNISRKEKTALKMLAEDLFALDSQRMQLSIQQKELIEA